jgi:hypothetical protein
MFSFPLPGPPECYHSVCDILTTLDQLAARQSDSCAIFTHQMRYLGHARVVLNAAQSTRLRQLQAAVFPFFANEDEMKQAFPVAASSNRYGYLHVYHFWIII